LKKEGISSPKGSPNKGLLEPTLKVAHQGLGASFGGNLSTGIKSGEKRITRGTNPKQNLPMEGM